MYLFRNITNNLNIWKSSHRRKPLIIRGARQVGKTSLVKHFAEANFEIFIHINFEKQKNFKKLFLHDLDAKRIAHDIELLFNKKIQPGKTLLFFDEIQDCPDAIKSLRYFYEDFPELHVIAAGSLLEFVMGDVSIPVGRVSYEYLYPLCFSEFLRATGRTAWIECLPKYGGTPPKSLKVVYQYLQRALKEYFIVGGMPEVVAAFAESASFALAQEVQQELINTFIDDIPKYASGNMQIENLGTTMKNIFSNVGKQVQYTKLGEGDIVKRTKNSLFLLEKAMLCHIVRSSTALSPPLGASEVEKPFKIVFLDIGLGQKLSGLDASKILNESDLTSTLGGLLAEQFVGQQLLAESTEASEGRKLYCWIRTAKNSTAEVDYLVVRNHQIVPIEVKSGAKGSLKSLHMELARLGTDARGLCLRSANEVALVDNIHFMPLFSVV